MGYKRIVRSWFEASTGGNGVCLFDPPESGRGSSVDASDRTTAIFDWQSSSQFLITLFCHVATDRNPRAVSLSLSLR